MLSWRRLGRQPNYCARHKWYSHSSILPIVDASSLALPTQDSKDVAQEIGQAFKEFGFVYLKNTRLEDSKISAVIKRVEELLANDKVKDTVRATEYNPYGVYHYDGTPDRSVDTTIIAS